VNRLRIITFGFIAVNCVLLSRLFYWQVIKAAELSQKARTQQVKSSNIKAHRGNILASDNQGLAISQDTWVLFCYLPDFKDNADSTAFKLANIVFTREAFEKNNNENKDVDDEQVLIYEEEFEKEIQRLSNELSKRDTTWVALKRGISTDQKKQIEDLKIHGLGFDPDEKRLYPEGNLAAHLLGFVGKNEDGIDTGYFGLEGYYDVILSGKTGFSEREANVLGIPLINGKKINISPVGGVDLVTHIDRGIQTLVEKKLEDAIKKYGAKEGQVTVIRPSDGAVLALAVYPNFEPSYYFDYEGEVYRNSVISDTFEPGSIFKPIVMASAIDANEIDKDTICNICDGPIKVDKYFINTWNNEYHNNSTMIDVLKNSDNVGMVFVANKLGSKKFYDYLKKFGFSDLTGIDLQGEVYLDLREKNSWSEVDLATTSFGQGIAVTPIQILNAVVIIARGGIPVVPQVVDKFVSGNWEEDIKPVELKRVISKEASDEIAEMMLIAAESGEAKWTAKKGYGVAGKTGTAQIPVEGHYDDEKTNASFVGFAPVNNPKFVMLVTLSEPETSQWASETAAPLWFDIAQSLFLKFGIMPNSN